MLSNKIISLPSTVCKLMEKIRRKHMDEFLRTLNYSDDRKHGVRGKRSCIVNRLENYDRVTSRLNKRDG